MSMSTKKSASMRKRSTRGGRIRQVPVEQRRLTWLERRGDRRPRHVGGVGPDECSIVVEDQDLADPDLHGEHLLPPDLPAGVLVAAGWHRAAPHRVEHPVTAGHHPQGAVVERGVDQWAPHVDGPVPGSVHHGPVLVEWNAVVLVGPLHEQARRVGLVVDEQVARSVLDHRCGVPGDRTPVVVRAAEVRRVEPAAVIHVEALRDPPQLVDGVLVEQVHHHVAVDGEALVEDGLSSVELLVRCPALGAGHRLGGVDVRRGHPRRQLLRQRLAPQARSSSSRVLGVP